MSAEIKVGQVWKNAVGLEITVTRLLSNGFVGTSEKYPNGARYQAATPGRYRWTLINPEEVRRSALKDLYPPEVLDIIMPPEPVQSPNQPVQRFQVGDRFTCTNGDFFEVVRGPRSNDAAETAAGGWITLVLSWDDTSYSCYADKLERDMMRDWECSGFTHIAGPSFKPTPAPKSVSCNCASQITGKPDHGDWCVVIKQPK